MERIVPNSVYIREEPLKLEALYKVSAMTYILDGRDGYESFLKAKRVTHEDEGKDLSDIITDFLQLA